MNNKLRIYCCYHKLKQQKNDDENTIWIYGPNDDLNSYLSEFSMFYWIWKNDIDSDIIATSHYRRRIYSKDFNPELVNQNSCQILEKLENNKNTFKDTWGIKAFLSNNWFQQEWLWKDYEDYTIKKYGIHNNYLKTDAYVRYYNQEFIQYSCFIITREHFMNMCDYIFGFLDYIDAKYELDKNPESYKMFIDKSFETFTYNPDLSWLRKRKYRLLAYLFEWMVSIYIQTNIQNYIKI